MLATLRELGVSEEVVESRLAAGEFLQQPPRPAAAGLHLRCAHGWYGCHRIPQEADPEFSEDKESDEYTWSPDADDDALTTMRKWRHEPRTHTHVEDPEAAALISSEVETKQSLLGF